VSTRVRPVTGADQGACSVNHDSSIARSGRRRGDLGAKMVPFGARNNSKLWGRGLLFSCVGMLTSRQSPSFPCRPARGEGSRFNTARNRTRIKTLGIFLMPASSHHLGQVLRGRTCGLSFLYKDQNLGDFPNARIIVPPWPGPARSDIGLSFVVSTTKIFGSPVFFLKFLEFKFLMHHSRLSRCWRGEEAIPT
jgi:hypothetical protein